jgi:ethanolamine utilization protein EutN
MLLARVLGRAVCTIKVDDIEGVQLQLVQPLDKTLNPVDTVQVAADVVEAGPGDLCVLTRSREAALAMRDETFVPVDLAIVGVVDELEVRQGIDVGLASGHNAFT